MRLTLVLQKTPVKWLLKQKWKVKGTVKDIPPNIPEPLKERGMISLHINMNVVFQAHN